MSKHTWVVTKENTMRCDCGHADCEKQIVSSRDWLCSTCGQTTWKSGHDSPDNQSYGTPAIECDTFLRMVVAAVSGSENVRNLVKAVIQ